MTTVPVSTVYARNVINVHDLLTVNVSAKIRDGTITEINNLTQYKHRQSNHYFLAQLTESCDLCKSPNQIT